MQNKRQKKRIVKYNNEKLSLSGNLFKKNKRRISLGKLFKLFSMGIIAISFVFVIIYIVFLNNKSNAESVTQNTVLSQLSKILVLPQENVVNIMRVTDSDYLSKQDNFYKNIKKGDYIIVYKNMSLIYDFDRNIIENIKTN